MKRCRAQILVHVAAKAAVPLTDMIKFVGEVGTTADDILNGFPVGRGNVPSASQEEEVL